MKKIQNSMSLCVGATSINNICLIHWIHNMLLKTEDISEELHNNSRMLVKRCRAPLAAKCLQQVHATFSRTMYIPFLFSLYLYEQLSILTLKMGPEGSSTTLVLIYEIK